jgi:acetylornithine deacetylase/succinyl-diaminopimelate desuccinylase-like protein
MKNGERLSNNVQASEKVYQSFRLEVTNPGGHSSLPVKENAIYRLADALLALREFDFPVALNDVTRVFFERSAALEEGELAEAMRGVLRSPPDPGSVAFLSQTPFYNARLRTTCIATMLDGGHAENALPQRATATVNCRVLPGVPIETVEATLGKAIGDHQVALSRVASANPSPPSPLTAEVLAPVERITEELWPGVPVIPTMSTGATDGLFLRNASIPVYGVSGLFGEIGDNRAHGQDERILVRSFFEGQEFLYRLTKALSRADQ